MSPKDATGGRTGTDAEAEPRDERRARFSRRTILKAGAVGVGAFGVTAPASGNRDGFAAKSDDVGRGFAGDVVSQTADVVGQGPDGDVVAADGATIWRTPNEILMQFSMPTPTPGEYTYPSEPADRKGEWWTDEVGDLEAFSLWAFIYNEPEECDGDCSSADIGGPAGGGAFGVAGHVFDGGDLTLNGVVSTDTDPYVMDGDPLGVALDRPLEAEVHLAVAPHGAFDPRMMPHQLQTPTNPGPDIWWLALFEDR